ncbi:MAG TPA: ribonuclease H-like domain-containing protein [Candidatus Nanoarchaeia archaeon]|nr:ribonuclease H-like domain-containing protein [Candidatus Nanoarchaeia archaeon]
MIERCFQFLEGIGKRKEEQFQEAGILTWDDFIHVASVSGVGAARKSHYDRVLLHAKEALASRDSGYFAKLPQREMWRLYSHFKDNCCFLDCEANRRGLIVVTLFDRFESKTFVRGMHLDRDALQRELEKYQLIVTYNGSAFDLVKLRQFGVLVSMPHIDLKPLCERLGFVGGLKEIERQVGIVRPAHLRGSAADAWRAFLASGDREWLELLVAYNEQDAVSLYQLMEWCVKSMQERNF